MSLRRLITLGCAVLFAVACSSDPHRGTVELIQLPAPSLQQSVLPNPVTQTTLVYLPPGHETSDRRYSTVYYLPGFTTDPTEYVDQTFQGLHLRVTMDTLIRIGRIEPMIVVIPNGRNQLGGSFWVDSPVTGNWSRHIVDDVVPSIDQRYPTIPEQGSRGLAGDSMGGFGAFHLVFNYPGIFGAVYAISPALFADEGPVDDWMFGDPRRVEADLELIAELEALDRDGASRRLSEAANALLAERDRGAFFRAFNWAYGAAFVPTTDAAPPLVEYPFRMTPGGPAVVPARRARWASGFGALEAKVEALSQNLDGLRGLVLDYGRNDSLTWIPRGCERLSELLTGAGVLHEVRVHDGSHSGSTRWRIEYELLPFFSTLLAHGGGDRNNPAGAETAPGRSS